MARPKGDAPKPPATLSGEARAEWRRVVPELYARGVFDPVLDRSFMLAYCVTWATYLEAIRALAEDGPTAEGYRGQIKKHPANQVAKDAAAMLVTLGSRFGLNPLDRQRLSMPPQDGGGTDPTLDGLLS